MLAARWTEEYKLRWTEKKRCPWCGDELSVVHFVRDCSELDRQRTEAGFNLENPFTTAEDIARLVEHYKELQVWDRI
jgi:hypothetical protein